MYNTTNKVEGRRELMTQIWQYTLGLEEYIIRLCKQINYISKFNGLEIPYPDEASDFASRTFFDLPAAKEFSDIFMLEETDYTVPE